ncbi:unnamed protein product [Schistosoma mattheei]|uniref:Secreted protein n=2 Tax=Schistosoma TaxID=6181 RepID=A0A183K4R5_9TREM|nr:unnamed protein product [Schistosoma curassoni]VDP64442.1 unnamed protein product [Schistosoma mattheei]
MASASSPSRAATALLTIGVSSLASLLRKSSNSHRFELLTLGYTTLKRAHAEVRLVNQSPVARRCNNGLKYFSIASVVWSGASFLSASTALSRTTVSSTFFQK